MENAEGSDWEFRRTMVRTESAWLRDTKTSLNDLPLLPSLGPEFKSDQHHEDDPESEVEESAPQDHEQSFVEFDLSSQQVRMSRENLHRKISSGNESLEPPLQPHPEPEQKELLPQKAGDDFFSSESEWKTMKKFTQDNYYDDMGNLEFTPDHEANVVKKWNRGYTRIDTEEQVNKYAKLDEKTDFLFEIQSKDDSALPTVDEDEEIYDRGDENIDSEETLAGTRSMLTDAQKFAYLGIVKLMMVEMATNLALLNQKTTYKLSKKLSASQKNFANWTLYIMSKLVDHLNITKEEEKMIDNLSSHGVESSDLTKSLKLLSMNVKLLPKGFDLRWVLVCDLFLLLLSDGYYDARSRALLEKFAQSLDITSLEVLQFERRLLESLEMDTSSKTIENRDDRFKDRLFIEKHIQKNRRKRLAYIGLATLGGSLAIGLSAGLLAPVIGAGLAAGLTTVGVSGTSGFLAGVGGSAVITSGGVAIGAKVGQKAGARRLGDVHTFELKPLHNNKRANLIVTVSGWMNGELDDVRLPFSTVDPVMGDMFSLLWEPEMLRSMGQTIGILASEALSTSIQQILGATILTALMSAIQLPMALSKLSYLLDNPWNVSLDRAWKAGKILADTLISGNLGVRPITLCGFSLGSRLIYSCLLELSNRGGYGLVENVILLGCPVAVKYDQITSARSVVSGKFINGYSRKDWILGYLFRATGGGLLTVAGLSPIENIPGIENFDCTEYVDGHMAYRLAIPRILKHLDWEVLSEEFAEIEEPNAEQKERQRKLIVEFDEARAKMEKEQQEEHAKTSTWKSWFKPKSKNWWDVYDGSAETNNLSNKVEEYVPGEHIQTTGAEPSAEAEKPEGIFDLNALLDEVNDIEQIAEEPAEKLQELRDNKESEAPRPLTMNEDIEEDEPTGLQKLGKVMPNPFQGLGKSKEND